MPSLALMFHLAAFVISEIFKVACQVGLAEVSLMMVYYSTYSCSSWSMNCLALLSAGLAGVAVAFMEANTAAAMMKVETNFIIIDI